MLSWIENKLHSQRYKVKVQMCDKNENRSVQGEISLY